MRYFTKDWYELCLKTSEHLSLEESKGAQQFSEEYYQELYQQRLNEFLLDEKEDAHTCFEDYYPEELDPELLEGMTEEEIEDIQSCYLAEREEAKQYYEPEPYDSEKSTQRFRELFLSNVERSNQILPQEILHDIADVRVYSLDKATADIIQRVEMFCEENEKIVQKTIEDYQKHYKDIKHKLDKSIIDKMNFHDCIVEKLTLHESSLDIYLDNSGGFTDVSKVRFNNCDIIKQEDSMEKSWWLYDEIYLLENGYEVHVLLENEHRSLIDFIVTAQDIQFSE